MKKITFTFLLLIAMSITLFGSNKPSKNDKIVKLSDVSSSLKNFQGNKEYDFVGDTIIYKEISKQNYDDVFKEAAFIYATIVEVSGSVDGINNNTIPVDAEFAVASISFAVKDLPKMKDKVDNLLKAIQKLNPKNDFKGLQKKKIPKAATGIKIAKKQLTESKNKLPELLKDLDEVSKKVIK